MRRSRLDTRRWIIELDENERAAVMGWLARVGDPDDLDLRKLYDKIVDAVQPIRGCNVVYFTDRIVDSMAHNPDTKTLYVFEQSGRTFVHQNVTLAEFNGLAQARDFKVGRRYKEFYLKNPGLRMDRTPGLVDG